MTSKVSENSTIGQEKYEGIIAGETPQKSRRCLLIGNGLNLQFLSKQNSSPDLTALRKKCSWTGVLKCLVNDDQKFAELLDSALNDAEKTSILRQHNYLGKNDAFISDLKTAISKIFDVSWDSFSYSCQLLDSAWENNYHILTTNFDSNIEAYFEHRDNVSFQCRGSKYDRTPSKSSGKQKQSSKHENTPPDQKDDKKDVFWPQNTYRWNSYFCPKDTDVNEDVSKVIHDIWHVHGGFYDKGRQGVLFSSEEYFNAISYFRNLKGKILSFDGWNGRHTWLKFFLEEPLTVVGVTLDAQESLLRHLLMLRARYKSLKAIKTKDFYLFAEENDVKIPDTVLQYMQFLGISPVKFAKFDDIYKMEVKKRK